MGLKGNVSNLAKLHFAFDKIYSNRKEMDLACSNDGIFVGRYVYVEYGEDYLPQYAYRNPDDAIDEPRIFLYKGSQYDDTTIIKSIDTKLAGSAVVGDLRCVNNGNSYTFYKCIGFDDRKRAIFEPVGNYNSLEDYPNQYIYNFNTDKQYYGTAFNKGWDSTVWQKVMINGGLRYIMIAEMNTEIPSFSLQIDPPEEWSGVPFFDATTTDSYYKLRWQPQWNFRIKSADSTYRIPAYDLRGEELNYKINASDGNRYLSDENIAWEKDGMYYNPNSQQWTTSYMTFPAAIFYNKAGFNKAVESNIEVDSSSGIKIGSTGKSGQLYTDNVEAVDTKEMSIILPQLGNAVSDMWNVVYGSGDKKNGNKRNMNIAWEDGAQSQSRSGLRLVDNKSGSYTYNIGTEGIDTLAGSINTLHDLIGMIIANSRESLDNLAKTASEKYIYFNSGKYYRKAIEYELQPVDTMGEEYIPVEDTLIAYTPNMYLSRNGQDYVFEKSSSPEDERTYFVYDENDWYKIDGFSSTYQPNTYYYVDGDDYVVDRSMNPDFEKTYYIVEVAAEQDVYFYKKGIYFIKNENGIIDITKPANLDKLEDYPDGTNFYLVEEKSMGNGNISYNFTLAYNIQEFNLENNYYSYEDGKYTLIKIAPDTSKIPAKCYTLNVGSQESFYIPGSFHFKTVDGFYKDYNATYSENREYYKLVSEPQILDAKFYKPNRYFYKVGDYYYKANQAFDPDITYYTEKLLYVIRDTEGIYQPGTRWNYLVSKPDSVTLGIKISKPRMIELEGYSRTLSTVNGLVLELHRLINPGTANRDTETVGGILNTLNDRLAQFGKFGPNRLAIVDDYGRMTSASLGENNEIEVEIDGDLNAPKVELKLPKFQFRGQERSLQEILNLLS